MFFIFNCYISQSSSSLAEKHEQHSNLCPLHSGSLKAKSSPTVGLAEALDVKGIPPELVTVLKSVHQFINRVRTSNGKNRIESSFLRHLSAVVSVLLKIPSLTCEFL